MEAYFSRCKVLLTGIDAEYKESTMKKPPEKLISEYFSEGQKILSNLSILEVAGLALAIEKVRLSGSTVYLAGNGGSASTASHFATDIGIGSQMRANPVKVISLCDNAAVITAISNDIGYYAVFEQQLRLLAKPGDLLIVISASGNSQNLVNVVLAAHELGISTYSMTGFDGGKLKELTLGKNVHVESNVGAYGLVEDAHLAICHVVTECVREQKE
jgi:D-sedoheptulose 7-phosphate isomerase